MTFYRLIAASASIHHRLQLLHQHLSHTNRIHLNQFWIHLTNRTEHILMILLHLSHHVLFREQRIDTGIGTGIDISRQMGRQVVDDIRDEVVGDLIEDIFQHHRVSMCPQRIHEGITRLSDMCDGSPILSFKQEEGLVFDT